MTMKKLTNRQTSFRIKQLLRNFDYKESSFIYLAELDNDDIDVSIGGSQIGLSNLFTNYSTLEKKYAETLFAATAAILSEALNRPDLGQEILNTLHEGEIYEQL